MDVFTNFKVGCSLTSSLALLTRVLADHYTSTDSRAYTLLYTFHYITCIALAYYSCLVVYWITLRTHAAWCSIKGYVFEYRWQDLGKDAWGWPWDYEVSFHSEDDYFMHLMFGQATHFIALQMMIFGMRLAKLLLVWL